MLACILLLIWPIDSRYPDGGNKRYYLEEVSSKRK
jgi:hypothetical protein